jgi:hypothetical protein
VGYSGGSVQDITFYKNPYYELTISKFTEAYIELMTQNSFLISLLIIEVNNYSNIDNALNLLNLVEGIAPEFEEELYSLRYKFEAGRKYILIPFTQSPKQFGNFDIKISTNEEILVKEILPTKHYTYTNIYNFSFLDEDIYLANKFNIEENIR